MTIHLAAESSGGSPLGSLLLLAILGFAFYAVAIRPARRRMRAAQQVQALLEPGRQVMTNGGLYAIVVAVEDDEVQLEVAPGVVSRYARGAVVRVIDEPAEAPTEI